MAGGVVTEGRDRPLADGEGDVGPVRGAAYPPTVVPGQALGHLGLVAAGGDLRGAEGEGAVAVHVLEPRAQAVGRPVGATTELGLEGPGGGHDGSWRVGRHPVRA